MKRYKLYCESVEVSCKEYEHNGFIDSYIANGCLNGSYKIIREYTDLNEALEALKQYKCEAGKTRGWAGVSFMSGDIYGVFEEEYNEDWEEWQLTGEMWFADEDVDIEEE